jgi:hypothetical protein
MFAAMDTQGMDMSNTLWFVILADRNKFLSQKHKILLTGP